MNSKSTLILAILAAVVAGGAWLIITFVPTSQERAAGEPVITLDREKIVTVKLEDNDTAIALTRSGDDWQLTEPLKAPADRFELSDLLNDLEFLTIGQEIEPGSSENFGFTEPTGKITVGDGDQAQTLILGKETAVKNKYYAKVEGREPVYVVDGDLIPYLKMEPDDFRDRRLVDLAPNAVRTLEIESADQTLTFERDGDRWKLIRPLPARADSEKVADLVSNIATTRVTEFIDKPDPGDPPGVDEPKLVLTLTSDERDTPVAVEIGNPAPTPAPRAEPVPGEEPPGPQVYARVAGESQLVTIPASLVENSAGGAEAFRDRNLIEANLDFVDRVRIVSKASDEPLLLERTDTSWQLAGDPPSPVEGVEVIRTLQALLDAKILQFHAPDSEVAKAFGEPDLTVALLAYSSEPTAEAPAGEQPVAEVEFQKVETDGLLARVRGEREVYSLDAALLDFLPETAIELQPTQLLAFAPQQLQRLKRTQNEETVELVLKEDRWQLAEGEGVLKEEAIESLVGALAKLKAVRWVGPEKAAYGLGDPATVLEFTREEAGSAELHLGGVNETGMTYGTLSGKEGVFLLNRADAAILVAPLVDRAAPAPSATPEPAASPDEQTSSPTPEENKLSESAETAKVEPMSNPESSSSDEQVAVMKTNKGTMVIEFWPDVAPKTVENFKKLASSGFYNGTAFHRIVKGFMIQGGDPLTKDPKNEGRYGTGDPGYKIKAEFNDRKHVRGVLSMARSQDPDSAGSQFFICLDPAPFLDRQYTGFGQLIAGEDVLLKIGDTPTTMNRGEKSKPTERIEIESVEIMPKEEAPLD